MTRDEAPFPDGEEPEDDEHAGDRDPLEFGSATPPAEWAVAVLGALFATAVIVLLVVHAARTPSEPPALETSVLPADPLGAGFVVPLDLRNVGGRAASDVNVVAELRLDDEVVEEASATVDYIPAGTQRTVLLQFTTNPRRGTIEVTGLGFSEE